MMRRRASKSKSHISAVLTVAGVYLVVGMAWILATDRILNTYQSTKGLVFVFFSTLLVAVLTYREWRQRATKEAELRGREGYYRALVEHAWDLITVLDADGTRKYHSPAIGRLLGYPSDEIVGRSVFDFIHPDDKPIAQQTFARLLKEPGGRAVAEVRMCHADGSIRFFHTSATNLLDAPNVKGIVLNTRDITERKRHEQQMHLQVRRLSALHAIDQAILESPDLPATLDVALREVTSVLNVSAARLLRFDEATMSLRLAACHGFMTCPVQRSQTVLGRGPASEALRLGTEIIYRCLTEVNEDIVWEIPVENGAFHTYAGLPLKVKGEWIGVLEIFNRMPLPDDPEWLQFARALAAQIAIAIESGRLFLDLEAAHRELSRAYDHTLEGWARALEMRDDETKGHSLRVTALSVELARALGVDDREIDHIRRGALLHDIGKIGIPDRILLKPGPLDADEWAEMHRHPEYARNLLEPVPFLRPALDIPYCHHEKWDGTGYPRGLAGVEIPLAARIFAIVDVWDALTSDRPYRRAFSHDEAYDYIASQRGHHFDPAIASVFLQLIDEAVERAGSAA